MMRVGRYKSDDELDLLDKIKSLENRISVLERTPQLPNSAVDTGGVTVYSGQGVLRVIHSDGITELLRVGLEETGFGPIDSFKIFYLDGETAISFFSNLFGFETWDFKDSTGNVVLGVDAKNPAAHGEGIGLARPWISQPVFPIANPTDTTSSGTFTTLQRGIWVRQHPSGTFWVQYNVTSTTAEVQVLAQGAVQLGPVVINNGSGIVNIGTAIMPGTHMEVYEVDYQFRVASGAGTVGARVAALGRERV
jgi:hypothetical protein